MDARMDSLLKVRVLEGLSCEVEYEVEMDRHSVAFALMLEIRRRTGWHWRRQKLINQATRLVIGEGTRLDELFPGEEAEIQLLHCDSSQLAPIEDRDAMEQMVRLSLDSLKYASKALKADKELVMMAVRLPGAFRYAAPLCQNDLDVARIAIAGCPQMFRFGGRTVRRDHAIASMAVQADPGNIRFVSPDLLRNRKFVQERVEKDGLALGATNARVPKEIIMAAVSQNGLALKFVAKKGVAANPELAKDEEVVMAAVQQNGKALKFAPDALRSKTEIVQAAVQQNPMAAKFVDGREAVLEAVRAQPKALRYVHRQFRDDPEVVEVAFAKDPATLVFAFKTAMLHMVGAHDDVLKFAKKSLQEDSDVLAKLATKRGGH
ncbi:unnamed protein product [Effrenium voratum]|uniref:DUF4116 domain-containing protein n=1 Tax=Effrenium voratum TaxID=2562239 RepID=A0AA36J0R2_9DINO|nr:unnamed protein product [Effrenium voratum]CAJ1452082.1 unnamed protein product [Effrenium voratum]